MGEYCDCRRIREMAQLGEEHETGTELADEADRHAGRSPEAQAGAPTRPREALMPDAQRAERGIFAEARAAGRTGYYIEDLEDDHGRCAEALRDPGALGAISLQTLSTDLHHHLAIEEYDLFPAAAKSLSEDQWGAPWVA